ncbi:hypothetical protein ACIOWI_36200 [Streptomyces sp. NPDC087659]|uniref:hypothetical protein n=1 Tax=Streptomyces sp. NPDC087659 TaxID=3365801 RepID=UPI0037F37EEC
MALTPLDNPASTHPLHNPPPTHLDYDWEMSTDPSRQLLDPASPTGGASAERDMEVDAYAYASEGESIQVAGPVRPVPHAADAGTGAQDPRHIPAPSDSAIHALNDRAHQLWVAFHDDTAPSANPLARILPPLPDFITTKKVDTAELFRVLNDPVNELATFGGVRDHIESKYGHACTIAELDILQNHCDYDALYNTPPKSIRMPDGLWKSDPLFAEAIRQWPANRLFGIRPQREETVAIPGEGKPMQLGERLCSLGTRGRATLTLSQLAELRRRGMRPRWVQPGVEGGDGSGDTGTNKGKSQVLKSEWVWKIFAPTMHELALAINNLSSVPDRTYVDTSGRVPIHVGAVFHQFETTGVKDPPKSLCSALQKVLQRHGGGKTLNIEGGVWRIDFPPVLEAVPVIAAASDSAVDALNDRAHQLWVAFHDDTAPSANPLARILPPLPGFITAKKVDTAELFRVLNDPVNELATFGGVRDHIESKYGHACTIAELDILQNHCDYDALYNPPPKSIRMPDGLWKSDPLFAEAIRQWPANRLFGIRPQREETVAIPGEGKPVQLGERLFQLGLVGRVALSLNVLAELRRRGMRPRWVQNDIMDEDGSGDTGTKGKSKTRVPKKEWVWKIFAPTVSDLESAVGGISSVPGEGDADLSGPMAEYVRMALHQFQTTGVKDPPKSLCSALQKVLQRHGGGKTLNIEGGVWRIDFPPVLEAVPVIAAASDSAVDALEDRAYHWWVAFHDGTAPSANPLARILPPLPDFITTKKVDTAELFRVLNDPVNELATFGGVRDHIESKYGHACTIAELDILQNHCDHHALKDLPPQYIRRTPREGDPKFTGALRQWPTNRLYGVQPTQLEKVAAESDSGKQILIGRRCQRLYAEGVEGLPLGELAELRRRGLRPRCVQEKTGWKWKIFAPTPQELVSAIKRLSSVPDRAYVDTSERVPIHVGAVFHQLKTTGVSVLPEQVCIAVREFLTKNSQGWILQKRGGDNVLLPAPGAGFGSSASGLGAVAGSGSGSGGDSASAFHSGVFVGRVDTSESMSRNLAQMLLDEWFKPYEQQDMMRAVLLRRAWALWSARSAPGAGQATYTAKSASRPGVNKYRWNNSTAPQDGPSSLENTTNDPRLILSRTLAASKDNPTPLAAHAVLRTPTPAQTRNITPPAGPTTAHIPPESATATAADEAFTTLTTTPTHPSGPDRTPANTQAVPEHRGENGVPPTPEETFTDFSRRGFEEPPEVVRKTLRKASMGGTAEVRLADWALGRSARVVDEEGLARAVAAAEVKVRGAQGSARSSDRSSGQVWGSPLELSVQKCLVLLQALREEVFARGVMPAGTVDDGVLGVRAQEGLLAAGPGWQSVGSWRSVQDALVTTGPGSMAFVLGRRLSGMGHAWAAYALPADTPGGPARIAWLNPTAEDELTSGGNLGPFPIEARAVIINSSAKVVGPDALTLFQASTSTVHALIDPASDHRYGAVSTESEYQHPLELAPGIELGYDDEYLAEYVDDKRAFHDFCPRIVLDKQVFYKDAHGQLYMTQEAAQVAGGEPELMVLHVPELALPPLAALPGDVGRMSVEEGMRLRREVRYLLAGANRVAGPVSLASLFAGTKWRLTPIGHGVTVLPAPLDLATLSRVPAPEDFPHLSYTQITAGVPAGGLFTMLELVQERYVFDQTALITGGKRFGDDLAARYAEEWLGLSVLREELPFLTGLPGLDDLRGYAWLLFSHVAARPVWSRFFDGHLIKNMLPAALRTSFDRVRRTLHPQVKSFLERNEAYAVEAFTRELRVTIGLYRAQLAPHTADDTDNVLQEVGLDIVHHDYLIAGLCGMTPSGDKISQSDAVGMTDYNLDTNDGRIGLPLILLELRNIGGQSPMMTDDEVETEVHRIVQTSQHAYRQAERFHATESPEVLNSQEDAGKVLNHPLTIALLDVSRVVNGLPVPRLRGFRPLLHGRDWSPLAQETARYAVHGGQLPISVPISLQKLRDAVHEFLGPLPKGFPGIPPDSKNQLEKALGLIETALDKARKSYLQQ